MKILVTGGAGYIGSNTCVELLNRGLEVVIVDNLSNSKIETIKSIEEITSRDVTFYEGDVCDKKLLIKIFNENKIDAVIHFAGLKAVGESVKKPILYYKNNLNSTLTLCEVMEKYGCYKLIFSSSATVYGSPDILPITEDMDVGNTTNPYGTSKYFIERMLNDLYIANNKWSITILRYFNPVGSLEGGVLADDPSGIPNNLMPYIIRVAKGELECLSIFGADYDTVDGTGVRDYIHVVDLAIGHIKALEKILNQNGVEVYNLGTGKGYSVLELVHAFEKVNGVKVPYKIVERRDGDIATYYADTSKAYRELGFKAEKSLEDMVRIK